MTQQTGRVPACGFDIANGVKTLANEDRIEKFTSWARRHKYVSIIVLASMLAASLAQVIQSAGTIGAFIHTLRVPPPPIIVDLALGTSSDRTLMLFEATVINASANPLYVQCIGVHVDDEGFIEHIWMEGPSHSRTPLAPGAKASYSRAIARDHLHYEKRADYSDIWLTVESNSESVFLSESLRKPFRDLWMVMQRKPVSDDGVREIVPTFGLRLKHSESHREASTFDSCTMESAPEPEPNVQSGGPASGVPAV